MKNPRPLHFIEAACDTEDREDRNTQMTQMGEAVARYHKLLEGDQFKDLSWAQELQERMKADNLAVAGRPVSPVLRPHFITRRQYNGLVKAVESFSSAVDRLANMAIGRPALMARMEMLPAEKMPAPVDPRFPVLSVPLSF